MGTDMEGLYSRGSKVYGNRNGKICSRGTSVGTEMEGLYSRGGKLCGNRNGRIV